MIFFPNCNLQCTQQLAKEKGLPEKLGDLYRYFYEQDARFCEHETFELHHAGDDALKLAHVFSKLK